ncbi:metal-sensing transcriptional repressor [Patescibacteria group bacterium]|nr:metal-sensing transcriptional repressor [Patescibacteria group bacterium]
MATKKEKALVNLKKTQSLLGKIIKMVESDEYCINIMQQNLAAIGMLRSAHQMLMENHLHCCFEKAIKSGKKAKQLEMVEEILKVTKLSNK